MKWDWCGQEYDIWRVPEMGLAAITGGFANNDSNWENVWDIWFYKCSMWI